MSVVFPFSFLTPIFKAGMEKKLKNVIGAPVGKTAVGYLTHMENHPTVSASQLDGSFEWLRQLITHKHFYKRRDNFLVSVKDIHSQLYNTHLYSC